MNGSGYNLYSYISIHALHEESDSSGVTIWDRPEISIHALHEESDSTFSAPPQNTRKFQSTLSMRRATFAAGRHDAGQSISIHALHEESDQFKQQH